MYRPASDKQSDRIPELSQHHTSHMRLAPKLAARRDSAYARFCPPLGTPWPLATSCAVAGTAPSLLHHDAETCPNGEQTSCREQHQAQRASSTQMMIRCQEWQHIGSHHIDQGGLDKGGLCVVLEQHKHAGANPPICACIGDGAVHHRVIRIGGHQI